MKYSSTCLSIQFLPETEEDKQILMLLFNSLKNEKIEILTEQEQNSNGSGFQQQEIDKYGPGILLHL